MNLFVYIFASVFFIMIWRFSLSTHPNNFGFFQIIGVFILGGIFGWYMNSTEVAILASILLSLIFI